MALTVETLLWTAVAKDDSCGPATAAVPDLGIWVYLWVLVMTSEHTP